MEFRVQGFGLYIVSRTRFRIVQSFASKVSDRIEFRVSDLGTSVPKLYTYKT